MINYIKDVNIEEHVNEYEYILVGTNTYCTMSQGFQRIIMLDYPEVWKQNLATKYADPEKLGTILVCEKGENEPTFVLLFICDSYNFHPKTRSDYLSYEALEKCMKEVNIRLKDKKIATTFLGASRFDGNGDRERIKKILEDNSDNLDLTIYDYFQKSKSEIAKEEVAYEVSLLGVDEEKRRQVVAERKRKENERKAKNGHTKR